MELNDHDLVGGPFAVIESDPGVFTSLTRHLGIPSLSLIELFSIEPWATSHLSPHGLIMCFLYKSDPFNFHRPGNLADDDADDAAQRVWFAKQLSDDACATHALLNVVLNCPGVDVGEELRVFKRETEGMSAVMRGLAVTNSRVIRPAHNSLARPSDIRASLNNTAITTFDAEKRKARELKDNAKLKENEKDGKPNPAKRARTAGAKAGVKKGKEKEQATSKPKPKRRRKPKKEKDSNSADEDEDADHNSSTEIEGENEEEETYHFIGYVPAHGKVWELDGLKSGPLEVGELPSFSSSSSNNNPNPNEGWMDIARPALRMKMAKYGGGGGDDGYENENEGNGNIRFSLLAIVDDVFKKASDELEFWRREKAAVERQLREVDGWEALVDPELLAESHTAFKPTYPFPVPVPSSSAHLVPESTPTPNSLPSPQTHPPFSPSFARRRMERDIEISALGVSDRQALLHSWEHAVREGGKVRRDLEDEVGRSGREETDHVKRTHDYEPFIRAYMHALRTEGLLNPLLGRDSEGRKVRGKGKVKPGIGNKGAGDNAKVKKG